MSFLDWSDEQLIKSAGDGLHEYLEYTNKESERKIEMWKCDIEEYERRISSRNWLIEQHSKELKRDKLALNRLNELSTGFSDKHGKTVYITHKLKDDENFIWEVKKSKSIIYIECGDLMVKRTIKSDNELSTMEIFNELEDDNDE